METPLKYIVQDEISTHAQQLKNEQNLKDQSLNEAVTTLYNLIVTEIQARRVCPHIKVKWTTSINFNTKGDPNQKVVQVILNKHLQSDGLRIQTFTIRKTGLESFIDENVLDEYDEDCLISDETKMCMLTSCIGCCLPIFFYWIPLWIRRCTRNMWTYKIHVSLEPTSCLHNIYTTTQ